MTLVHCAVILIPPPSVYPAVINTLVVIKSTSCANSGAFPLSTQDTNAIRPSIHSDCSGVLGSGVGARKGAAGGPKTAGEGTP